MRTEITERIYAELQEFELTEEQIIGFMFHLGYTIDQNAKYIGVYGPQGLETGIMQNSPLSYLLPEDFEVEENVLDFDTEDLRNCYFTFAKVIHEVWVQSETPLSSYINVGPNYLFTGEIQPEIWEKNKGASFIGNQIDEGTLNFFQCIGAALLERDINDMNECLWYGKDLHWGSTLDDPKSYSYVVDKINTVLPPFLKMFLSYPINYELNHSKYIDSDSFSNIFSFSLKLEENKLIRELSTQCQLHSMYDEDGGIEEDYILTEERLFNLMLQFAYDGFNFKYSLYQEQLDEVFNAGNVYKLEQYEGKDIDINTYANLLTQIVYSQFGYNYSIKNWSNYGAYLQFLSFYFMLAMRYSVYLNNLIEKQ